MCLLKSGGCEPHFEEQARGGCCCGVRDVPTSFVPLRWQGGSFRTDRDQAKTTVNREEELRGEERQDETGQQSATQTQIKREKGKKNIFFNMDTQDQIEVHFVRL